MRRHFLVRALPGLAVLALLCLAAAAPAPLMPAPPPLFTQCPQVTQTGGGTGTTTLAQGTGVTQPLPAGMTVAACSLRVQASGWSWSGVRVQEWDPLTLAPDPSAIALRTRLFDPSSMNYYTTNSVPALFFVPPVVTQSVSGVADPPRQTVAIGVYSLPSSFSYGLQAYFEASGTATMPAARAVGVDGSVGPLPGDHPVIAHAICVGDADLQQLRVAQSVRHVDNTIAASTGEIVQRFRVPVGVELRWIELAVASGPGSAPANATSMPVSYATVAVVDGATLESPTATMPASLLEASFGPYFYYEPAPRWATHTDFDHTIVLQPGHDYWLYVRDASAYRFYARTLTGGESATFTAGIGPLYTRTLASDPWTPVPDRAFAFTILGRPADGLGARPPRGEDGIRLQVSPNPARDLAEVTWSGGVGPVTLQVYDARGRRVATGEGGAAGTWRWSTTASRAQPLPGGIYFVRAHDSSGGQAVERVVIVR